MLTNKGGEFDKNNADSLAREIAQLTKKGMRFILVHGGGSFTKDTLLKHEVKSDFLSVIEYEKIVANFRNSIKALNYHLTKSLREVGLEYTTLTANSIFTSYKGEILSCNILNFEKLLISGSILLHGDILRDWVCGYYVCSSDKIVSFLAKMLRPSSVLFLTDVDGIYEEFPPRSQDARPLRVADQTYLARIPINYQVGVGEIHGKLAQAVSCAFFTKDCYIVNGRIPGNLSKAITEDMFLGTKVVTEIPALERSNKLNLACFNGPRVNTPSARVNTPSVGSTLN